MADRTLTDLVGMPPEDPGPPSGHRRSSLRQHHVMPFVKKVAYSPRVRVCVKAIARNTLITHVNNNMDKSAQLSFSWKIAEEISYVIISSMVCTKVITLDPPGNEFASRNGLAAVDLKILPFCM